MFTAVYSGGQANLLSKQVRAEIKKYIETSPSERLAGAAKILQEIRLWESLHKGYPADKGIINQANYSQTLIKKALGVRVVYTQRDDAWVISMDDVPHFFRLISGTLSQYNHKSR